MLLENNYLYNNIKIHHCLLDKWEDIFILFDISNKMVYCNSNNYKHMSYIVNFYNDNYKTNFYITTADKNIEKDHIYSGYIHNNIKDR